MAKNERMSRIIMIPMQDLIGDLAVEMAVRDELYHDEIQEILYRISPVVAIGRRYAQGRPIEPIDETEMDQVREWIQDRFFEALDGLKDSQIID